jgi:membrane-anchored protein YejM (alkaline phosphatase superfamily)
VSQLPDTLVENIQSAGYNCYGVSGNGFTSQWWEFDKHFDQFTYTRSPQPFVDGKDMHGYLRGRINSDEDPLSEVVVDGLYETLNHQNKLKSLANFISFSINYASRELFPQLSKVPLPFFGTDPEYAYTGKTNTEAITRIIDDESGTSEPFFVFTNYMETHRPLLPDETLQKEHVGRVIGDDELTRLNEEAPQSDGVEPTKQNVADIRGLYTGEVETLDRYLGQIVSKLKTENIFDETLIIVTADHGEMLGETVDNQPNQFGHKGAMTESLARVPMVLSQPVIAGGSPDQYV